MTHNEAVEVLVRELNNAIGLIRAHQIRIFALEKYLSEQPHYNAARFGEIFREYSEDMTGRSEKDLKKAQDELLKILVDFEGPAH